MKYMKSFLIFESTQSERMDNMAKAILSKASVTEIKSWRKKLQRMSVPTKDGHGPILGGNLDELLGIIVEQLEKQS
jgi:hypothetical protein